MFERFTEASRRVVLHARDEARQRGDPAIATVHLLLGLLDEAEPAAPTGAGGVGGRALIALGVTAEAVRAATAGTQDATRDDVPGPDPLPFASDAKGLLELAPREALRLGHRDIGTEHLALALAAQPDSGAVRVLSGLGVERAQVRARVLELVAGPAPSRARAQVVGRTSRSTTSVQLSPEAQELLARSARKALQLGVAYASKGSLPLRLLGSAGNAALGMAPADPVRGPEGPSTPVLPGRGGLRPATCSFCGTPSPACGALLTGATGALICERCVEAAAAP